ncbi:MAG: hypothetical protein JWQ96_2359 [Segetibacter sp.]|nr:hypothetical protein [Segetibacter sp.]
MKVLKYISKALAIFIVSSLVNTSAQAQESKSEREKAKVDLVKKLVNERNFVFKASTANPQTGGVVQLTSSYGVTIAGDSVISSLPYFGRAYSAPIDPSRGGIEFTSTNYELTIIPGKRGGWEITIEPKDTREVRQMFLSVSQAGYASLRVISNNRQAISFSGEVGERKKNKNS